MSLTMPEFMTPRCGRIAPVSRKELPLYIDMHQRRSALCYKMEFLCDCSSYVQVW